jgi:hypothetical protein
MTCCYNNKDAKKKKKNIIPSFPVRLTDCFNKRHLTGVLLLNFRHKNKQFKFTTAKPAGT